jgi:4-alpha-glucanotransferase
LGDLPIIAEDLGVITPDVVELRDTFNLPGMRIFQFGFGREADSADHLPHNYPPLCAAYPGNHDSNTLLGWFQALRPSERRRVLAYTGGQPSTSPSDTLRALFASPAGLVICPMQDVFGLDSRARINVPGTGEGNWNWRMAAIPGPAVAHQLKRLAALFGRHPS